MYYTKYVIALYLIINLSNVLIAYNNEGKYLAPIPTDESINTPKKYEEVWTKIKDFIRSTYNNS